MKESYIFEWKNKRITTNGDLINALFEIKTKVEARDFLEIGSKATPWIMEDIQYNMGYLDKEKANKIWGLFKEANMNAWYRLGIYHGQR